MFLIDIRHTPTANDKLMYDYIIKCGIPCLVIANKADKIAITKVDNQVDNLQSILNPLKDLAFCHILLKEEYMLTKSGKILIIF